MKYLHILSVLFLNFSVRNTNYYHKPTNLSEHAQGCIDTHNAIANIRRNHHHQKPNKYKFAILSFSAMS